MSEKCLKYRYTESPCSICHCRCRRGRTAPRSRLPTARKLSTARATADPTRAGNVDVTCDRRRDVSDPFLAESQPQKNHCRAEEQQKHDNHDCQPLPLPSAPRGDAVPDSLPPWQGHRACFCTSASADRYGYALSVCALNVLIFARLAARNGYSAIRQVQDNGIQCRGFAVGAYRLFAPSLCFDLRISVCLIERIGCSFTHSLSPCPQLSDNASSRYSDI
jgi:hypothetical protein